MSAIKPIRTRSDYEVVVNRVYTLMEMDEASMPQHLLDELSVLGTLLESYEAIECPVIEPDPISVIEFHMDQRNLTLAELQPCIGTAKKVAQIMAGKRPLTLKMIRSLDEKLKIPATSLTARWKQGLPKDDKNIEWDKFPISELATKSFFKDRRDPIDHSEEMMRELIQDAGGEDNIAIPLFRKSNSTRQNSRMDSYALQAWCLYVLAEARSLDLEGKYINGIVDKGFLRTIALLSKHSDGPLKAREFLSQKGIALIYAPHLPKTYLDGAAMITKEGVPVIGMTIRYDRLDNFWFCLLHELAHIGWHLKDGKGYFVDDLSLNDTDFSEDWELEKEADALAQSALIPNEIWFKFKYQKSISLDEAYRLAEEASVHPSVVAGRFRREFGNYRMLTNLVGKGEVRKWFE